MQYNGGKAKVARELAEVINSFQPNVYWEPFVGAGNVIQFIDAPIRFGSDLDEHIISYLHLVQNGWNAPDIKITPELYQAWKTHRPSNIEEKAIKAMIGYGCSFGGLWFGSFARDPRKAPEYSFFQTAQIASRKQAPLLKGIQFFISSFAREHFPHGVDLIYCDPPYRNTTRCGTAQKFHHDFFWAWCQACAMEGIRVLVTEFSAPSFAQEIWTRPKPSDLRKKNKTQMIERLFLVHP